MTDFIQTAAADAENLLDTAKHVEATAQAELVADLHELVADLHTRIETVEKLLNGPHGHMIFGVALFVAGFALRCFI